MAIYWHKIDAICPKIHYFDDREINRLRSLSPPQADRFQRTRTYLRQVLGTSLHIHPRSVEISYTPWGKPIIVDHSIYFNLSHSQNLMVIALSNDYPVGIDLEMIKPRSFHHLIRRYFCPAEQQWFRELPPADLPEHFYCAWVKKEAYAKLQDIPLRQALAGLNTIPGQGGTKSITIEEISAPIGYKCALAYGTL